MIDPDNEWKKRWNLFVAIVTTFEAIETPVRIAFAYPRSIELVLIDFLTLLVFSFDIFLTFRTAIIVRGRLIRRPHLVAGSYLRGWFTVDLLGTIPFHYLLLPLGLGGPWHLLEWSRLLRLSRLWRFTSYLNHQQSSHFLIRRMVIFLYWIAIIVHLTACGWIMVGQGNELLADRFTRYLRSLYWTITTVSTTGYGDITPKNNAQTIFATVTMVLGAGIYASFVGNIASILTRVDGARAAYQEKLERMNTFMRYNRLPEVLKQKIIGYHAYLWETGLGYNESSLTADLPPSLRVAVTLYLNKQMIQHVPVFEKANEIVLHNVVNQMESIVFTPGDFIFREGEIGKSMYFISHGRVEVVSADGATVYATLREGDYFGELALLDSSPRTASVRALNYCNLYILYRETFDMLTREFPEFAADVQEKANERRKT